MLAMPAVSLLAVTRIGSTLSDPLQWYREWPVRTRLFASSSACRLARSASVQRLRPQRKPVLTADCPETPAMLAACHWSPVVPPADSQKDRVGARQELAELLAGLLARQELVELLAGPAGLLAELLAGLLVELLVELLVGLLVGLLVRQELQPEPASPAGLRQESAQQDLWVAHLGLGSVRFPAGFQVGLVGADASLTRRR